MNVEKGRINNDYIEYVYYIILSILGLDPSYIFATHTQGKRPLTPLLSIFRRY
jgi:hypothetical protein